MSDDQKRCVRSRCDLAAISQLSRSYLAAISRQSRSILAAISQQSRCNLAAISLQSRCNLAAISLQACFSHPSIMLRSYFNHASIMFQSCFSHASVMLWLVRNLWFMLQITSVSGSLNATYAARVRSCVGIFEFEKARENTSTKTSRAKKWRVKAHAFTPWQ